MPDCFFTVEAYSSHGIYHIRTKKGLRHIQRLEDGVTDALVVVQSHLGNQDESCSTSRAVTTIKKQSILCA